MLSDAWREVEECADEDISAERIREMLRAEFEDNPLDEERPTPLNLFGGGARPSRELTGISTGFADLDALTGGFEKGKLTVIAGHVLSGKSTLAQNIARKAAKRSPERSVVLVSSESNAHDLNRRLIFAEGRVDLWSVPHHLRPSTDARLQGAIKTLLQGRIYLAGSSTQLPADRLAAQCRRHGNLELLIVDTAEGLFPSGDKGKALVQNLKLLRQIAVDLDIPVVATYTAPCAEKWQLGVRDLDMAASVLADKLIFLSRADATAVSEPQKGLEIVTATMPHQDERALLAFFTRWGRMGGVKWES